MQARLGTAAHFCEAVVLKLSTVPIGTALSFRNPWFMGSGSRVSGLGVRILVLRSTVYGLGVEVKA